MIAIIHCLQERKNVFPVYGGLQGPFSRLPVPEPEMSLTEYEAGLCLPMEACRDQGVSLAVLRRYNGQKHFYF